MTSSDIDEVLSRDTEGKLNWLVGEVTEIKQDVSVIKNNHLSHIGVVGFLIAAFTGIQVM